VEAARQTQKQLKNRSAQKAKRLAETLATFIPCAEQVMDQTIRRILQGKQVPAREKIVSLFACTGAAGTGEAHTDIVRRGKESKPVAQCSQSEYGHKI